MFIGGHLFVRAHTIGNAVMSRKVCTQIRFYDFLNRHIGIQISQEYEIDIGTRNTVKYREFLTCNHTGNPRVTQDTQKFH